MAQISREELAQLPIRERILKAARNLALEEGWGNVSTRKIAEKIEYSTIKLYSEFGSKDAILKELQIIGFQTLYKRIAAIQALAQNPETALLLYSSSMWAFANEQSEMYEVMFGLNGASCKEQPVEEMRATMLIINKAIQDIHPEAPFSYFNHWWAVMHGYIALQLGQPRFSEANILEAISLFIKSIRQ
ncbi:MAG: TetR/AcrR family transcriptional regulator [Candidatus Kapaibacteriota bacterium]